MSKKEKELLDMDNNVVISRGEGVQWKWKKKFKKPAKSKRKLSNISGVISECNRCQFKGT